MAAIQSIYRMVEMFGEQVRADYSHKPHHAPRVREGDLVVSVSDPFHSRRLPDGSYEVQVTRVASLAWDGSFLPVFWSVCVPGYQSDDWSFRLAPEGTQEGDWLPWIP